MCETLKALAKPLALSGLFSAVVPPAEFSYSGQIWTLQETVGTGTVDARALGEALPAKPPRLLSLGERLLWSGFRASCQAMKAAAQFCGMAGEDARRVGNAWGEWAQPDLQALLLSGPLPLSEIAAAHRERK